MNVEETKQILRKLRVNYPNSYQKLSDEDTFELVDLWHLSFKDIPAETVAAAVFAYMNTNTSKFAPNIGEIKELIREMTTPNEMTEQEAFNLVKKAMSYYHAEKKFAELPPVLQKLVGSPQQLRDWALMNTEDINTVVASNFMRSYRMRVKSERDYQMLPEVSKQMIDTVMKGKLLK